MPSSKSNYQNFAFQALIDLLETDRNKTFILALDVTLVTIMKSQYFYSWNMAWSYNSLSSVMSLMVFSYHFFSPNHKLSNP